MYGKMQQPMNFRGIGKAVQGRPVPAPGMMPPPPVGGGMSTMPFPGQMGGRPMGAPPMMGQPPMRGPGGPPPMGGPPMMGPGFGRPMSPEEMQVQRQRAMQRGPAY